MNSTMHLILAFCFGIVGIVDVRKGMITDQDVLTVVGIAFIIAAVVHGYTGITKRNGGR